MNYRHINSTPDTTNNAQLPFPGFATTGSQQSTRWTTSESLRSTFGANLVNEFRIGGIGRCDAVLARARTGHVERRGRRWQSGRLPAQFQRRLLRHRVPADQSRVSARGQSSREASTRVIEDTATWLKGNHNVTFGGIVRPGRRLAAEPDAGADGELRRRRDRGGGRRCSTTPTSRERPRPTSRSAQNLYAMLTGRISSLTGDARITPDGAQYVSLGLSRAEGRMREFDFFAADSWRLDAEPDDQRRRALRAGAAVLSDQQQLHDRDGREPVRHFRRRQPVQAGHADRHEARASCSTRRAPTSTTPTGTTSRQAPALPGSFPARRTASAACSFGSKDGDSVIRAGGAMAYQRPGMSDFTGVFGANQGIAVNLQARFEQRGTLPILLRSTSRRCRERRRRRIRSSRPR